MPRGFTIRETDVYRLIMEEMNDNAFAEKVKFSIGEWIHTQATEGKDTLLIQRLAMNNRGVFDVVENFDETTYVTSKSNFVATSVGPLNGEFMALNKIKDVVYDTTLTFLVCIDNVYVQQAVTLAVEEVRSRLIQYERTFSTVAPNVEDMTSTTKTESTLKVIMMSGSIDYGDLVQINGHSYLTYSFPITIEFTNFGEFANQQKIYLGVDAIVDGEDEVIMHELEPNDWHWGTAIGVGSSMLVTEYAATLSENAKEIKSVPKNKGFAFHVEHQLDFADADLGAFLKFMYKESLIPTVENRIYTLRIETYLWSDSEEDFVIDTDLTMERFMQLTQNQPPENVSKGEKLSLIWTFVPLLESEA